VTLLSPASLVSDLFSGAFAGAASRSLPPRRIGAEVEFIPVEVGSGRRLAIDGKDELSTLPLLRRFGREQGWIEGLTPKGTPCFTIPTGGNITYEPGGQLEFSSPACLTASSLLAVLRSVVLPLRAAAAAEGIDLLAVGIDPTSSIQSAPLLIQAKRYQLMADYFETLGSSGARMMRQTASFQINLDFDDEPWLRWRVLNAMAPFVTAIFANSPIYAQQPTGHQSTRAAVWRTVDPSRTGLAFGEPNPVETYRDFALNAPAMLFPPVAGEYRSFAHWLTLADPSADEWHDHLSTLFPEVRPRGHLELRSADTLPPAWFAAPVALTAGVLYHSAALRAADALLGTPDPALLERAGRWGLHDPRIHEVAADLFQIALKGCRVMGEGYFHPADLEQAQAYFDLYTRRGRAPADDILDAAIAA
jgi:glutamate--cysteine ligase